jgi:hypothetical protein
MRDGDRVRDPVEPRYSWEYRPLAWWVRACSGLDYHGCRLTAWDEGDGITVQHGPNPEAVRHFSLDELNQVGCRWQHADVVLTWCEQIHRAGLGERGVAES